MLKDADDDEVSETELWLRTLVLIQTFYAKGFLLKDTK